MILDLVSDAAPVEYEADLCIIGAGPAGMSIARGLADAPISILVLESGGMNWEQATQDLARGDATSISYSLEATRLRMFGGTTRHWEGWSLPLRPCDFRKREWVPLSGWPFGFDELASYYPEAHRFLGLGPYQPSPALPTSPTNVRTPKGRAVFEVHHIERPMGPTEISRSWEVEAAAQKNLTVVLHANVLPMECDGGVLRGLTATTLGGKRARVRAKTFVLATGGIENARLLLASGNLANGSGMVGRCFMEHVFSGIAAVLLPQGGYATPFPQRLSDTLLERWGWRFTDEAAEELGVLSCAVGLANEKAPPAADVPGNGEFVPIYVVCEQAPNPDSFVALSAEKDPMGVPRASLHWAVDDLTQETVRQAVLQFSALAAGAGLGRVFVPNFYGAIRWPQGLWPACHHMGTTRMSADPKLGVVNADCRAHDVENLYIAGSSVFPTCGHVNPTLNLTVLAMRLADHLRSHLRA